MANTATRSDFVNLVAEEISFGIDHALDYWLGRIEMELVDDKLTPAERLCAIEFILARIQRGNRQNPTRVRLGLDQQQPAANKLRVGDVR